MLFITNPHLRKLEAFMQEVPHFPPKGAKVDFDSLEDEILLGVQVVDIEEFQGRAPICVVSGHLTPSVFRSG